MPDLSFLGPTAASVLITFAFLRYLEKENTRRDDQHKEMMNALNRNTKATAANDKYLRDRNGRDSELWLDAKKFNKELVKTMHKLADRNLNAYQKISTQKVEHQHVKQSDVEHETIKEVER